MRSILKCRLPPAYSDQFVLHIIENKNYVFCSFARRTLLCRALVNLRKSTEKIFISICWSRKLNKIFGYRIHFLTKFH